MRPNHLFTVQLEELGYKILPTTFKLTALFGQGLSPLLTVEPDDDRRKISEITTNWWPDARELSAPTGRSARSAIPSLGIPSRSEQKAYAMYAQVCCDRFFVKLRYTLVLYMRLLCVYNDGNRCSSTYFLWSTGVSFRTGHICNRPDRRWKCLR